MDVESPKRVITHPKIQNAVNAIQQSNAIVAENSFDNQVRCYSQLENAELERFQNDTTLKTFLTWFVIIFSSFWSIAILVLIFLIAYKKATLSDAVIITLITETLAIVIGLPLIVTRHFFPQEKKKDS